MLQFHLKIAHLAGSVNTAADFLSRLELKVTEKVHLKIREDVQTTPIEVSTSSSDVADEEQFFFTQPDSQDETEEQILQRKEQPQKNGAEWVVNQELSSLKPSVKEFTKIDGKTTSYSINGIETSARIRVEQDADLILKSLKLKLLGQPHDDVLLATDRRYRHYKAKEDRIILKDGLLFRKYYGETGSVKYYQILIPKQLVNEVLRNIHGEFGKHPQIRNQTHLSEAIQAHHHKPLVLLSDCTLKHNSLTKSSSYSSARSKTSPNRIHSLASKEILNSKANGNR